MQVVHKKAAVLTSKLNVRLSEVKPKDLLKKDVKTRSWILVKIGLVTRIPNRKYPSNAEFYKIQDLFKQQLK